MEEESTLELIELVPEYPADDDRRLAAKLLALKEFEELTEPFGKAPNPFGDRPPVLLYNHQEVVTRYFSPLTGKTHGLIMPDPGLGKTPIAVVLAEQAAKKDSKALIFTQNPVMEQNFRDNILLFTGDKYASSSASGVAGPKEGGESRAKIADYYEFRTYSAFSSTLLNNFDREKHTFTPGFIEGFRGRRIIMDESHHIRATRQAEAAAEKGAISDEALNAVCGEGRAGWMRGVRQSYRAFFLFLHLIEECSVFLLTATPMVDRKTEFCFQLNLLLPPDRLFVAPNSSFNDFLALEGDELLREVYGHCRGMISYARSRYRATRVDLGEAIGEHDVGGVPVNFITKIVSCPTRPEQYEVIKAIERAEGGTNLDIEPEAYGVDEADKNSFKHRSRAASSMVLPFPYSKDDSAQSYVGGNEKTKRLLGVAAGTKGEFKTVFSYFFEQTADRRWELRRPEQTPANQKHIAAVGKLDKIMRDVKSPNGLEKLSSKYAHIIRKLNSDKDDDRRVTYIYSPLLEGSGLIPLMVALSLNGYRQYVPQGGNAVARLLEENAKYRAEGKPPPRRIALISSGAKTPDVKEIKAVLNHPANARGALIHAVLGSPTSGESISFHHVRRVLIASPTWNEALLRQAIGRAFRLNSQLAFSDAEAFVEVELLAATPPVELVEEAAEREQALPIPTDVHIFMLAELKGRKNGGVYRAAKQCCFDGMINKELNQRPGLVDITAEDDYSTGTYPIVSGDVELLDDGSFSPIGHVERSSKNHTLYYDRARLAQREAVLKFFRTRSTVSFDELASSVAHEPRSVLYALDRLIEDRTQAQDALGVRQYIKERDNAFSLQPSYGDSDPFLEHYSRCLYVEGEADASSHVETAAGDLVAQMVEVANGDPTSADELFTSLYNVARELGVGLLIEGYVTGRYDVSPEVYTTFINRLSTSVGTLEYADGSQTAYHRLYYIGGKRRAGDTSYGKGTELKTAKELGKPSRMRVFDLGERRWRGATLEEDRWIVTSENTAVEEKRTEMSVHWVYGYRFLLDGALHLFFPALEKERITKGSVKSKKGKGKKGRSEADDEGGGVAPGRDKRFITKIGKASENKTTRVDVLWRLAQQTKDEPRYYLDYEYDPSTPERREELIADMKDAVTSTKLDVAPVDMPDEQLYFFWWFLVHRKIANKNKSDNKGPVTLVALLEARLERLGLIVNR
jgi:hypothetical protein